MQTGICSRICKKFSTWEDRQVALSNQLYIFAKQSHAQVRLLNKVDYAISDSPLILNLYSQVCQNAITN